MTNATTTQQRNKAAVQDRFDAWATGTGSPFESAGRRRDLDDHRPLRSVEDLRRPRGFHARGHPAVQRPHAGAA